MSSQVSGPASTQNDSLGPRGLGFRGWGLRFKGSGFRGLGVQRFRGLGFRGYMEPQWKPMVLEKSRA